LKNQLRVIFFGANEDALFTVYSEKTHVAKSPL